MIIFFEFLVRDQNRGWLDILRTQSYLCSHKGGLNKEHASGPTRGRDDVCADIVDQSIAVQ